MSERSTTVLMADSSTWPERLGRDFRPGYRLAAITSSVDETVDRMAGTPVDLVVADLELPGGGAAELCRRLSADVPVLVATYRHGEEAVLTAIAEGACGYLVKAADIESIQTTMAQAAIGEPVLNWPLAGLMLSHFRSADTDESLTTEERKVIQLMARNQAVGELADTVHMTVAAVEQIMRDVFYKLRSSRRAKPIPTAASPYSSTGHGPT